jgi:NADP-dependent 3-hydroxy acid dehydrogenase YdfG
MSTVTQPVTYDYPRTALQGKAILISGGTTGIGRATAVALAAQGGEVMVFGRTQEHLDDAMKDIEAVANGSGVHGVIADQSRREDVDRVFSEAESKMGGVDILINNAGIPGETVEEEDSNWEYILGSNLLGCMACCEAAIPIMKKRGGGQIVNIGSMSAKSRGAGTDIYVATKSGMRGFTESLSKGVAPDNIRVSLIEPGLVSTNFFDWSKAKRDKMTKAGEAMKSEDIAECIVFALTRPSRCHIVSLQVRPSKDFD